MKRNDYIGWQEVFRFSLIQGMKEKAYYGFLIFMSVVLILSQPIMSIIQNMGNDEEYHSEITCLTVYDETGLPIDYSKSLAGEAFGGVNVSAQSSQTFEEHVNKLKEDSEDKEAAESTELIVHITYEEEGYFNLTFVKAANAAMKKEDCEKVADAFTAYFDETRIQVMDVTKEQLAFLNKAVDTKLEFLTETGEIIPEKEKKESISMEEYTVLLGGIMVVMMIINLGGSNIAVSIVTEKSTRVVEYLMINVRPMALIVGKILSCLTMVIVQFAVMGISYGISSVLNGIFFNGQEISTESMAQAGNVELSAVMEIVSGISVLEVIVAIIIILCGVMFFSILAGLAGASVSKLEELGEGMKLYQLLIVGGSYLGIAMCVVMVAGGNTDVFVYICSLLPISAPFVVPACILLGKIPMSIALISMLFLLIITALLFTFTAKVYESMIFYNGSVLKLKDIIQIAKNRRQTEREEVKQHE